MRTKLLLPAFLMLFNIATSYAQSSASQAGIAVQGIARDNSNTAITSGTVGLTFELYYLDASSQEQPIFSETVSLNTDAFGVFSHVLDPTSANSPTIAKNTTYLRIKRGTDIISDEKLKHVPYAIAANNGVPTGAIMPFIGTTAPAGWALCDGSPLPGSAADLIAMVGADSPDLRGMFIRGAGQNQVTNYNTNVGPNLKERQQDENLSHTHSSGTLANNSTGVHSHDIPRNSTTGNISFYGQGNEAILAPSTTAFSGTTKSNGDHTHTISGNTANSGGTESRPVNYGVNYIIKL